MAQEDAKVVNINTTQEEKKPSGIMDGMNQELMRSVMETILPKAKVFIGPALDKFREFLGDDDKTIIIRHLKDSPVSVIVFDNNQLDEEGYNIHYSTKEKTFTCSKNEIVFAMVSIDDFVDKLLTGEFSNLTK